MNNLNMGNPNMNNLNMNNKQNVQSVQQNFTPNFPPLNPRNINRQQKDATINRNIYLSGYGAYQMCPYRGSMRVKYRKDFNRGQVKTICKVLVKHLHALDIVGSLSNKGLSELKSNNPYPTIINPMYRDFNGNNSKSDDSSPDENVILRTNFAFVVQRQENLFPVSSDSEIVYTNPITIIRDAYYNQIAHENLYRTGVITVTPQRPELIEKMIKDGDRYEKIKILASKHLFKLQTQLETAFQVAAMGGHNSIVISLFDQEFGIPIDDQIMIYNYCIMKYGHFFNAIIFGIPPYQPEELATYIDENIMKPQRITADVEMTAKADIMSQKFEKNLHGDDEDSNIDRNDKLDIGSMTDSEKVEYMKKVVKKKRKEMKAQAERMARKKSKKAKR